MKKLLIFGAGGFVAPYLANEYKRANYTVYGAGTNASPVKSDIYDSAYTCDILSYTQVQDILIKTQPDIIINLAAISSVGLSWQIPKETIDVNVCGAINILEAVRLINVKINVLLIGSSEEYTASDFPISENGKLNANNPYGISKMMLEKFCEIYKMKYGMKIFHVRPFNHTGIGQREDFVIPSWCKQIADIAKSCSPGVIKVGNLDIYRDFSNVKDIVRAYRMILESNDDSIVYNVGSGGRYSLRDILNHIIGLSSQKITIEQDERLFRPIENKSICCDHSLISRNLGWEPHHSIFETVEDMYNYYLSKEV